MPEEIPSSPRIEQLRRRLEADPNSRLFLQLAEEYRRAGALKLAARVCKDGLDKHPNYHAARVALARACVQMGNVRDAVGELKKVLRAAPDNILAGKLLGQIYESVQRHDSALAIYQRLLPYDPDDAELLERIDSLSGAAVRARGPGGAAGRPEAIGPARVEDFEGEPVRAAASAEGGRGERAEGVEEMPGRGEGVGESERAGSMFDDGGTAILDEPPELEGGSAASFLRPLERAALPEEEAPLPPEMQGERNEMTHDLHQELDQQPADQAIPDTLNLTPSPDLLPREIRTDAQAPSAPARPAEGPAAGPAGGPEPGRGEALEGAAAGPARPEPGREETPEGGEGKPPVVSRTMAELLHRQGHLDEAIGTMERLVLSDQATRDDEKWLATLMAERGDGVGRRMLSRAARDRDIARVERYRRWLSVIESK